jgi:hypothetical protein
MFLRVWGAGSPDDRYLLAVCDLPAFSLKPSIECMLKRFDQPAMGNLITAEVAARTGSFTKAAQELAVGQPDGSHAVCLLGVQTGPYRDPAAQAALCELQSDCALVADL